MPCACMGAEPRWETGGDWRIDTVTNSGRKDKLCAVFAFWVERCYE
jgi:hypothetical protein